MLQGTLRWETQRRRRDPLLGAMSPTPGNFVKRPAGPPVTCQMATRQNMEHAMENRPNDEWNFKQSSVFNYFVLLKRRLSSESSQTKVPKRKLSSGSSQAKVPKRKIPSESSQAKDPKRKFPSEGSQTKVPKRSIPSESSQANDPERKIPNQRCQPIF